MINKYKVTTVQGRIFPVLAEEFKWCVDGILRFYVTESCVASISDASAVIMEKESLTQKSALI